MSDAKPHDAVKSPDTAQSRDAAKSAKRTAAQDATATTVTPKGGAAQSSQAQRAGAQQAKDHLTVVTGEQLERPAVPDYVLQAFQIRQSSAEPLGLAWDYGSRYGNVVLSPVAQSDQAAWSAKVREKLQISGMRVVRPVRATDGRFVNSGWRASQFVQGQLELRGDELVQAALRFDDALRDFEVADQLFDAPQDVFAAAQSLAWKASAEDPDGIIATMRLDPENPRHALASELIPRLVRLCKEVPLATQICHADFSGTVIFDRYQAPTLVDIVPVVRCYGYTAAVVVVDQLLAGALDIGVLQRFSQVEHFEQLVLRALLYRIIIHCAHPQARVELDSNIRSIVDVVVSHIHVTL